MEAFSILPFEDDMVVVVVKWRRVRFCCLRRGMSALLVGRMRR